ncbi:restriction endonuclease subunit S [Bacillus stercoris]|uniref:restriction endonuclease subunit S n=1 Tax=Bacillus stercoris TaxID=2054641 RepID=UPI002DBB522A|nr:restriction endonuclease subunit S [Bacillus stercoris]MEC2113199.1 restriction endonuclease subunit S [Bacillus stercoris]
MPTYKLKELVTEVISGEWGQEPSDEFSGVKVIRTTNFSNTGRLDLHREIVKREIEPEKVDKKRLLVGDIIIEKSGGSPEQPVGRVVFFEETDIYLCNNFTSVLRPNKELVEPKYLMYLLFNLHKTRRVLKFQNKTTGIINLKLDQYLQQTEVIIPSKEVQQKIVKVLDKKFELINKRQTQIAALSQLTQSVFLEMFGDSFANDKSFPIQSLSDIASIRSSKRVFVKELVDEGIPFYRGTEIGSLALGEDVSPALFISELHYNSLKNSSGVPKVGDLLMPSICPDGRIWRVQDNDPFYFKDGRVLWIHFTTNDINTLFIQYALKDKLIRDYSRIASGTTFAELKIFSLKKLKLMVPPLDLQNKFASIVSEIDAQKKNMEMSLQVMENNYNSLLLKAFKGELFQV